MTRAAAEPRHVRGLGVPRFYTVNAFYVSRVDCGRNLPLVSGFKLGHKKQSKVEICVSIFDYEHC